MAALGLSRTENSRAAQQAAAVASSTAAAVGSTIVTDPDVEWVDGILRGTVGATSTRDLPHLHRGRRTELGRQITFATDDPEGQFSYLADMSAVTNPSVTEQFSILVAETTDSTSIPVEHFRSSACSSRAC